MLHLMSVTPGPRICRYSPSLDHNTHNHSTLIVTISWSRESVTLLPPWELLCYSTLWSSRRIKMEAWQAVLQVTWQGSSLQPRWISGTQLVRGIWHGCDKTIIIHSFTPRHWLTISLLCPRVYKIVLSKQCSKCGWPIFSTSDAGLVGVTLFTKLVITFEIRPDHF